MGISRDDAGKFLPEYQSKGILSHDPFATIDMKGVAPLMKISVEKGRSVKPDIKVGFVVNMGVTQNLLISVIVLAWIMSLVLLIGCPLLV